MGPRIAAPLNKTGLVCSKKNHQNKSKLVNKTGILCIENNLQYFRPQSNEKMKRTVNKQGDRSPSL